MRADDPSGGINAAGTDVPLTGATGAEFHLTSATGADFPPTRASSPPLSGTGSDTADHLSGKSDDSADTVLPGDWQSLSVNTSRPTPSIIGDILYKELQGHRFTLDAVHADQTALQRTLDRVTPRGLCLDLYLNTVTQDGHLLEWTATNYRQSCSVLRRTRRELGRVQQFLQHLDEWRESDSKRISCLAQNLNDLHSYQSALYACLVEQLLRQCCRHISILHDRAFTPMPLTRSERNTAKADLRQLQVCRDEIVLEVCEDKSSDPYKLLRRAATTLSHDRPESLSKLFCLTDSTLWSVVNLRFARKLGTPSNDFGVDGSRWPGDSIVRDFLVWRFNFARSMSSAQLGMYSPDLLHCLHIDKVAWQGLMRTHFQLPSDPTVHCASLEALADYLWERTVGQMGQAATLREFEVGQA